MRDRTAMTEPLTIGQRLVARWEGPSSGWSEPADLAEAIDAAIAAEREACASKAREFAAHYPVGSDGRNTFIILAEWIENRL
jgi:hypothetical protein